MKQLRNLILLGCLALSAAACSDDDTGGGATTSATSSTTSAVGSGGTGTGSGGGATSTGSGGASTSSTTGSGGVGTGGGTGEPTVQMTVDPTTMAAGDTIQATIVVTNFILEEPVGQPNQDGHGHYHIYLDQSQSYLVAGQTETVAVKIPASTSMGPHTLRCSLGNNDHSPLSPPVEDIVDITVE